MSQTLFPNLKPETVRQVRVCKSRSESINPANITNHTYQVCAQSEGMPGLNIGHGIKTLRFFYGHFFIDNRLNR
jgi:hypothetical protein